MKIKDIVRFVSKSVSPLGGTDYYLYSLPSFDENKTPEFIDGNEIQSNKYEVPKIRQYTTSPSRFAGEGDILMSVRAPVGALNIANNDCCIGRGLSALSSKIGSITHLYYTMNDFRLNLPVVIPTETIIAEFEKVCEPIFNKQMVIGKEINTLTKQRDELLPLLMNGQASVNYHLP